MKACIFSIQALAYTYPSATCWDIQATFVPEHLYKIMPVQNGMHKATGQSALILGPMLACSMKMKKDFSPKKKFGPKNILVRKKSFGLKNILG